jgi:ABC-type phosphate/phosphonate transport system substrate-binding protein
LLLKVKWFIFAPVLFIGVVVLIITYLNKELKESESGQLCNNYKDNNIVLKKMELSSSRKKFIIRMVIIPMVLGFSSYLITDRIYGDTETIIIGISNASYSDTIDFAKIYKKNSIDKANQLLGGYNPILKFDIVTVSGGYSEIWNALDEGRIDIAFVSPFNFYNKYRNLIGETKDAPLQVFEINDFQGFDSIYTKIGGKYTALGSSYRSGFLLKKRKKSTNSPNIDTITNWLKQGGYKLYFSKERLSTSGRIIPYYCLRKKLKGTDSINTILDTVNNIGTLSENIKKILKDSCSICTFSNDMWYNMKRESPKLADSLYFIPIKHSIPMDPVIVRKEHWEDLNEIWRNISDFIKLRNIDIRRDRHDIIISSLRYIMNNKEDKTQYVLSLDIPYVCMQKQKLRNQ